VIPPPSTATSTSTSPASAGYAVSGLVATHSDGWRPSEPGTDRSIRDALLLIDLVSAFDHEDGSELLASFRDRLPALREAIARARAAGVPVVYVNDAAGSWDSDAPGHVRDAVERGRGGDAVAAVAPRSGDRFLFKPRYSAFDHTPLTVLLRELEVDRLLVAGAATERCVVQSAIDARELGFKVTLIVDACSTVDERMERLSLEYAERIAGVRLAHASELTPGAD
jgi:nicotinamidase-related amidase